MTSFDSRATCALNALSRWLRPVAGPSSIAAAAFSSAGDTTSLRYARFLPSGEKAARSPGSVAIGFFGSDASARRIARAVSAPLS